ncbi:hypothetical protein [Photobacterium leiognathi]|uniref:hypothetical protein n=1 Tax=Photobacterium leiognathi TaxID=553611 RepID=UPI002980E080|nr:hypothetical protein [Photobacterium leiognathi]
MKEQIEVTEIAPKQPTYWYSLNDENWSYASTSINQAIKDHFDTLSENERLDLEYVTVYRGEKVKKTFEEYFSIDALIEDMQNRASDDASEFAEDYLDDITDEQQKELESVILAWATKHNIKPSWFDIENVVTMTIPVKSTVTPPIVIFDECSIKATDSMIDLLNKASAQQEKAND